MHYALQNSKLATIMKHLLSIILIALSSTVIAADYPTAKTETVCNLASSKQYPRHSEGDFVKLKDGRIMFVYSRYNGSSNHDDAPADLVKMVADYMTREIRP